MYGIKKVVFSKKQNNINVKAFEVCYNLQNIEFSGTNRYFRVKGGVVYNRDYSEAIWILPATKKVSFDSRVKQIQESAFSSGQVASLALPASLRTFKANANHLGLLSSVSVDKNNKFLACDGGTIYEKKTKQLVLALVKNHRCDISDKVEIITKDAALCGMETNQKWNDQTTVHLPSGLKQFEYVWTQLMSGCLSMHYYFHGETAPKIIDSEEDRRLWFFGQNCYFPIEAKEVYLKFAEELQLETYEYNFYVDGKEISTNGYTYIVGKKEAQFVKYTGKSKQVVIPSEISGRKVTSIKDDAFYKSAVEQISIPDTVTRIGTNAFRQCMNLKSLKLPANLCELGSMAFYKCSNLNQITIPKLVEKINISCFHNCTGLKKVTILGNIEAIETYAFRGCTSLDSIESSGEVKQIGIGAFENCTALKNVSIGSKVEFIDNVAFSGCKALESVGDLSIEQKVGTKAFKGCTKLTSVFTLEETCSWVGRQAFYDCKNAKVKVLRKDMSIYRKDAFDGCQVEINK